MKSEIVLECEPRRIVGVGVVRIVVVAGARWIAVVVIAASFNSIVSVVGFSIYPLFLIYFIYIK